MASEGGSVPVRQDGYAALPQSGAPAQTNKKLLGDALAPERVEVSLATLQEEGEAGIDALSDDEEQPHSCARTAFRVLVLATSCFLTFGSYYSYDNPAALLVPFEEVLCDNSTTKYLMLYSIYSIPNTVQPFIGGYLIDNVLGLRFGATLFCLLIALGSAVVAVAATIASNYPFGARNIPYFLALAGRFLFGLGGESLTVTQSTFVAKWFKGKELATAFAINLSFSRVGSAVNFALMPVVLNWFDGRLGMALFLTAIFCVASLLSALLLWWLDVEGERLEYVEPVAERPADEEASISDVFQVMGLREILIYFVCIFFYVSVFVFISVAPKYFERAWGLSASEATQLCALPYTIGAVISPFLGLAVDRIGYSLSWVLLSAISLTVIHSLAALTLIPPAVMVIGIGVVYSICAASLWPMVAMIVDIKWLGTAYGLMTALQNLGLAVAPIFIGMLEDHKGGTIRVEQVFAVMAGISALFAVMLLAADLEFGGMLNMGSNALMEKMVEEEKREQKRAMAQVQRETRRAKEFAAEEERRRKSLSPGGGLGQNSLRRPMDWSTNSSTASSSIGSPALWHSPGWHGTPSHAGKDAYLTTPLLREKTAFEMRKKYLAKLDVLMRIKGPLS